MITVRRLGIAGIAALLASLGCMVAVISCRHASDGEGGSISHGEVPSSERLVNQDDIQIIERPGLFGVGGFFIRIMDSKVARIPATTVHLPRLPVRKAAIVLYLRVPPGQAERLKAAGGSVEFSIQDESRSIGGQVAVDDLRVTTSPHLSGDLLYSDEMWVESLDEDLRWQPKSAKIALTPRDEAVDVPVEAIIMSGGSK